MPGRLTTSVLVRRDGHALMFDAGEGIQLALKKGSLGIRALDAIAISHLHADHVLGIPGIMMFRAQNEDPGPLTIFGPPGLEQFIRHTIEDLKYRLNYPFTCHEWSEETGSEGWKWNGATLIAKPLNHSTFCLGYRLEEPMRPGKFNAERALELGVESGPQFGKLQSGETITTPHGKRVSPSDVLGPPRPGRVVVFATDTSPCTGLTQLMGGADIAFVEGMFTLAHFKEAETKKHMTADQTGRAAAEAGPKQLVLVHISPRYTKADEAILAAEAKKHFETTEVAAQLKVYPVPLVG